MATRRSCSSRVAPPLEGLVIGDQCIDRTDAQHRAELTVMGLAIMALDDPVHDTVDPVGVVEEFLDVDARNFFVDQAAIFALQLAPFDREPQNVFIADRVGDDVFMQALAEQILGRPLSHRVFRKDRGAGETEHLRPAKERHDAFVGFAELRPMAFVKDEHDPLVLHRLQRALELVARNGRVQLLDRRDDQLVIARQLLDQCTGIVRAIDRTVAEMVELLRGLIVEVAAVNDEDHLVYLGVFDQQLCGLEAWSASCPTRWYARYSRSSARPSPARQSPRPRNTDRAGAP